MRMSIHVMWSPTKYACESSFGLLSADGASFSKYPIHCLAFPVVRYSRRFSGVKSGS